MTQARAWAERVDRIIASTLDTGEPPFVRSGPHRALAWACFPVACSPCLAFSCIVRVLFMPRSVAKRCDDAVTSCVDRINERLSAPPMPLADFDADRIVLVGALDRLEKALSPDAYDRRHYVLVDSISLAFPSHHRSGRIFSPASALEAIRASRQSLLRILDMPSANASGLIFEL